MNRTRSSPSRESAPASDAAELTVPVEGMHCGACVSAVERALSGVDGVEDASVSMATENARVRFDAGRVGAASLVPALVEAVRKAGYEIPAESLEQLRSAEAERERDERRARERERETRLLFRKFWVGAALSIPILLLGHHEWVPGLRG
ncbi:MAG: cation transporter, partial [bacterium]